MFFGTVVVCRKSKNSWNVKWDILPVNNNTIQYMARTKLTVFEDGEEEKVITDGTIVNELEYDSDKEEEASPTKSER
jgi:hypothetical protein